MYVESDSQNRIIIQDVSLQEASFIKECVCSYLSQPQSLDRHVYAFLNNLKEQLDTNTNG